MPYPESDKTMSGAVASGQTLLRVIDPVTLSKMEDEAKAVVLERTQDAWIYEIARRVQTAFELAKRFRLESGIDDIMISALNQRDARYDDDKLTAISQQGGSDVFMQLTATKCRAFENWVGDIYGSTLTKPWFLDPTPVPDLPPDMVERIAQATMQQWMQQMAQTGEAPPPEAVMQMAENFRAEMENQLEDGAKEAALRMDRKIQDQLYEGHWQKVFNEFVIDLGTLPCGLIKGPFLQKEPTMQWSKTSGRTEAIVEDSLIHTFSRVSPLDAFPGPGASSVDEGDFCERIRLRRADLSKLRGVPNYSVEAIEAVLSQYGNGGVKQYNTTYDSERSRAEYKGDYATSDWDIIEGIDFWGSVPGTELIEMGMKADEDGNRIDAAQEYEANVTVLGSIPIYGRVNPDPLLRRPYSKTVYQEVPGSFWGKGVPQLMSDLQQICNASMRAMVNNLGISSGPQVVINDVARLPAGEDIENLYPWKVWQFVNNGMGTAQKPIDFFQPESNVQALMSVYQMCARLADDYTGIPAYTYGNERVGGAGRTMGGLSMLMTAAARGIKKVVGRIHEDVVQDVIQRLFDWNMKYLEDESLKGDVKIRPVGIIAIMMREQMGERRLQVLDQMNRNPVDSAIFGPEGRAAVWRAALDDMEMDPSKIVKSDEEIAARVQAAQAAEAQVEATAQ